MTQPALLPQPRLFESREGSFSLTANDTVNGSREHTAVLRRLLSPATGLPLFLSDITRTNATIFIVRDSTLAPEHYVLEITPSEMRIEVADEPALVWAVQTIRQLLGREAFLGAPVTDAWTLPCLRIEDGPRFGWRGSHLDTARHFVPMRDVLAHLDLMALHKLNVFHLHLTDDQGWRFESIRYPRLTEVGASRTDTLTQAYGSDGTPQGGFYTQDQLSAIVAYAGLRGITVVPEIEFPGHVTAALAAYPELAVPGFGVDATGREFGVIEDVLNMSEEAMALVFGVWEEVLDIFPSSYVHIGGDEVPRVQWQAPAMAERIAELGLEGPDDLQPWFTLQLRDWLRERGRVAVGWDEIVDDGPIEDMVCLAWRNPEVGAQAAADGMDVVMAPLQYTYFDYYPSDSPSEPYRIGGLTTVEKAYGFDPLSGVDPSAHAHVLGAQCQMWTEYSPTYRHVEYMLWTRAAAFAEVAWSDPSGRSWEEFEPRLRTHLERFDALGLNHRPLEGPRPWQQGGTGRFQRPSGQAW